MTAPRLSDPARAVLRWIERCGGRVSYVVVAQEFGRRQYAPEDLDAAIAELLFAGRIIYPEPGVVEARKGAT